MASDSWDLSSSVEGIALPTADLAVEIADCGSRWGDWDFFSEKLGAGIGDGSAESIFLGAGVWKFAPAGEMYDGGSSSCTW